MFGTAIATAGRILWRMLERRGIDPAPLFKEAGLDPASLHNPLARYPVREARLSWVLAAERVGDPAFGLSAAKVWQPSDFHALGCAFMASATLRGALNRLVRYHAVVYDVLTYALAERDGQAILSYNSLAAESDEPAILQDACWALVLDGCRRIYDPDLDPLEVSFWHPEPRSALQEFFAYFSCPVRFGEPMARMIFPSDVLDRTLPASNRELALANDRTLADYLVKLRREDIVSRTKSAIGECLPSGNIASEVIAEALRMSPRSLQRKLAAADTSYRQLVDAVRQELAESYLADRRFTLAEISYLLGFSSQAAFTRAFRRWKDRAPREYRGVV